MTERYSTASKFSNKDGLKLVGLHIPWKVKNSPKPKLRRKLLYHLILRLTEGTYCQVIGNKYVFECKTLLNFVLFFLLLLNNFQLLYKKAKSLEKIIKIIINYL